MNETDKKLSSLLNYRRKYISEGTCKLEVGSHGRRYRPRVREKGSTPPYKYPQDDIIGGIS